MAVAGFTVCHVVLLDDDAWRGWLSLLVAADLFDWFLFSVVFSR